MAKLSVFDSKSSVFVFQRGSAPRWTRVLITLGCESSGLIEFRVEMKAEVQEGSENEDDIFMIVI